MFFRFLLVCSLHQGSASRHVVMPPRRSGFSPHSVSTLRARAAQPSRHFVLERSRIGTLCGQIGVPLLPTLVSYPPHCLFSLAEQFFGMYIYIYTVYNYTCTPHGGKKSLAGKKMDRGGLPWPLRSFPLMSFRQARLFGACAAAWWECRPSTFRPCRREGVAQWLTR